MIFKLLTILTLLFCADHGCPQLAASLCRRRCLNFVHPLPLEERKTCLEKCKIVDSQIPVNEKAGRDDEKLEETTIADTTDMSESQQLPDGRTDVPTEKDEESEKIKEDASKENTEKILVLADTSDLSKVSDKKTPNKNINPERKQAISSSKTCFFNPVTCYK